MSLSELAQRRAELMAGEVHPAVEVLAQAVRERFGDSVSGVLFYGSCLRGGDPFDGLVDLYVIVESYRGAYRHLLPSIFNWLLPPNVYYLEAELDGRKMRAKYAVVSMPDFQAGTSRRWFHSYLWARFAQPIGVAYHRDPAAAEAIYQALARSVVTFIDRVLPVISPIFDTGLLWREGLMRTYRAELRVEQKERTAALIETDKRYYESVTEAAVTSLSHSVITAEEGYGSRIGDNARRLQKILWSVRTLQGKVLSVLRLSKALFTFVGGLDYIVWKLERHSGESIELPERVRRAPLIFGWSFFWRLYRKGVFR